MWLKRHERPFVPLSVLRGMGPRLISGRSRIVWRTLLILLSIVAAYCVGAYSGIPARVDSAFRSVAHIDADRVKMYIDGKLSKPKQIIIDINHENYQRLAFKREEALRRKMIITEDDSYVPATLTVDGRPYRVEMRLKGDMVDHLQGDKWSFRFKVKNGEAIWGMRRFSIQDPSRSGYIREWIFHQWMHLEGLIALRYDYVDVILNGRDLGVFALEESFGKELIEHNRRREGPIVKFDESIFMNSLEDIPDTYDKPTNKGDVRTQTDMFFAASVDSFQTTKVASDEVLKAQFVTARNLLEGLRAGKRKLSEVFDIDKAARLFAMLEILDAHYSIRWKNARFYFNPVNQKLELIAYNAYDSTAQLPTILGLYYQGWLRERVGKYYVYEWIDLFFSDREFTDKYYRELTRISAPGYLEGIFEQLSSELERTQSIIYKDGRLIPPPLDLYLANRDIVYELLHPKLPVRAHVKSFDPRNGTMTLTVVNTAFLPIDLHGVECSFTETLYPSIDPARLTGKSPKTSLEYRDVEVNDMGNLHARCSPFRKNGERSHAGGGLQLVYEILGTGERRRSAIDEYPVELTEAVVPGQAQMRADLEALAGKGLVAIDEEARTITFRSGAWQYSSGMIVIPPGYRLVANPGTRINLTEGASIVSFSAVSLQGSDSAPVVIQSSDATGQGLTVMSAGEPSIVRNTLIAGQTALSRGSWALTGAVTFYESDVEIERSVFSNNHAEDSLNVVRSRFSISGTHFETSASDAVDIDFGAGNISESEFRGCGNDCIDVSGSEVTIERVVIQGAGDKGVSVGEQSTVVIRDTTVSMANMAVVSKDGSDVSTSRLRIENSNIGLAAYQKKPEFSGAKLTAEDTATERVAKPYHLEKGSTIVDDGRSVAPNASSTS